MLQTVCDKHEYVDVTSKADPWGTTTVIRQCRLCGVQENAPCARTPTGRLRNYHNILGKTPIQSRLRVSSEMMTMDFLCEIGVMENRAWTDSPEDQKLLKNICNFAKKITEYHIKQFKEWEEDGRP